MSLSGFINRALLAYSKNTPFSINPALVSAGTGQIRQLWSATPLRNTQEKEGEKEDQKVKDSKKDRTKVITVETSIKYLNSSAYATTYGSDPVWKNYRRNHKGHLPPTRTRKTCIRGGQLTTGNSCPICRDEYLVVDARNIELIKQFISPYNGETLSYKVTGVCQKRYKEILVAIEIAKDKGLITYDVPFREYDYDQYRAVKS